MKKLRLLSLAAALCLPNFASAQQSAVKVKLGVLTDMTSIFASWAGEGSVVATRMAVEDFLKASPNSGIDVEVVSADFQLKPDIAVGITKKWLSEGLTALVDVPLSSAALATNSLLRNSSAAALYTGPLHDDLTTKECSPNSVHWTHDTSSLTRSSTQAIANDGDKSWFLIRQDAIGAELQANIITSVLNEVGGEVIKTVVTPSGNADFSSALLQAQASRAKVIGLVQGGADMVNAIKQANEYALVPNQRLMMSFATLQDTKATGLSMAQGLLATEAFYWNADDEKRTFAKRFAERNKGVYPSAAHAGAYSAVTHYLKAVKSLKKTEGKEVIAKMKEIPVTDPLLGPGNVRTDGRMVHDLYLLQVNTPEDSTEPWDVYKVLRKIPGDEAFRPMSKECSLVS